VSVHRYPPQTLMGDYMRAGLGLLLTLPPLLWLGPGFAIGLALTIVAGVCLFFVARTVERNRAVIAVDDDGVVVTSFTRAAVRWDEMSRMTLAYYAVKRDKQDGWMELTLRDAKNTIKVDSRLEGFLAIVVRAARVARERQIPLNQITLSNLRALKITGE
jgi:hypothetical protein